MKMIVETLPMAQHHLPAMFIRLFAQSHARLDHFPGRIDIERKYIGRENYSVGGHEYLLSDHVVAVWNHCMAIMCLA